MAGQTNGLFGFIITRTEAEGQLLTFVANRNYGVFWFGEFFPCLQFGHGHRLPIGHPNLACVSCQASSGSTGRGDPKRLGMGKGDPKRLGMGRADPKRLAMGREDLKRLGMGREDLARSAGTPRLGSDGLR